MPLLSALARARLIQWMDRNPGISQTDIGRAVGHGQGWVSKYRQGTQEADIDELDGMARVFEHTIYELIDVRPNQDELALLDAYRALPADRRKMARGAVEAMLPVPLKRRRSSGTR